jgi:Putative zinc-finger
LEHPHAELSAYIDDALDPAVQAAVDGHLVTCGLCRAHVVELRATAALVQALPDPVPSRRLVPRLAMAPSWLAPLRTLMTLASGAAVFLFLASALLTNIAPLATSGAPGTTAGEATGDTAAKAQAQPAATTTPAPAPTTSPNAAFAIAPTSSPVAGNAVRGPATAQPARGGDTLTGASAAPDAALSPQDAARTASSLPQRSPLLDPWLWLALAILCGVAAIAINRRLRSSV